MPASIGVVRSRRHVAWQRLAGVVLLAGLSGCGGSDAAEAETSRPASDGGASTEAATPKRSEPKTIDPATVASLAGVVRTTGTPPTPKFIKMVGEAWCLQQYDGGGMDDDRVLLQDGRLANAFVWVKDGLDDYEFEPPAEDAVLDQVGCLFEPRIMGMQRGQRIMATNSDPVMHNVHSKPDRNRPKNFGMPSGSKPRDLELKKTEVMVQVICDVHAWMRAWIGVVDHPFFAVTGSDGAWRLDGLPPGTYTVGVWHEVLGEQELTVTLAPSESKTDAETVYAF